jgi:hypothetical protein
VSVVVIEKSDLVRRLAIAEKLDLIPPLASDLASPKGTQVWERFIHLRRLRDDLVHIKGFGYGGEPTNPQAHGRLLRGDGESAVQDAARLIHSVAPGWLNDPVLKQLGARDSLPTDQLARAEIIASVAPTTVLGHVQYQ